METSEIKSEIKYVRELLNINNIPKEISDYLKENYVPVIEPEVTGLLKVLIKAANVKSVLEIGTAIGYSAIIMANAMGSDGSLVTIERFHKSASIARKNFKLAGLCKNIRLIEGEALEILSCLEQRFDMIFLDGAKGQYLEFLPFCLKLLKPGGLLVTDDVLYKGMVSGDAELLKRKITIVKRLRQYLKHICSREDLTTSVLPIGDGVSVSVKLS